jgi:hypothetical protein
MVSIDGHDKPRIEVVVYCLSLVRSKYIWAQNVFLSMDRWFWQSLSQQYSGALRTGTTHAHAMNCGRGQRQWYSWPKRPLTQVVRQST